MTKETPKNLLDSMPFGYEGPKGIGDGSVTTFTSILSTGLKAPQIEGPNLLNVLGDAEKRSASIGVGKRSNTGHTRAPS